MPDEDDENLISFPSAGHHLRERALHILSRRPLADLRISLHAFSEEGDAVLGNPELARRIHERTAPLHETLAVGRVATQPRDHDDMGFLGSGR